MAGSESSFEARLTALEAVVERLERGELSLDESVRLFEEGVKLSSACKLELEKAEGRVQVLVETEDGAVQVAEMDDSELDAEEGDVTTWESGVAKADRG